ncbi:hypothetical protein J6590_034913 [Homalodisca vitripennis]|nr:hypothetical protein J6590_034913 [Homalodisca vitripennis]
MLLKCCRRCGAAIARPVTEPVVAYTVEPAVKREPEIILQRPAAMGYETTHAHQVVGRGYIDMSENRTTMETKTTAGIERLSALGTLTNKKTRRNPELREWRLFKFLIGPEQGVVLTDYRNNALGEQLKLNYSSISCTAASHPCSTDCERLEIAHRGSGRLPPPSLPFHDLVARLITGAGCSESLTRFTYVLVSGEVLQPPQLFMT